jgi:hypothetical protein
VHHGTDSIEVQWIGLTPSQKHLRCRTEKQDRENAESRTSNNASSSWPSAMTSNVLPRATRRNSSTSRTSAQRSPRQVCQNITEPHRSFLQHKANYCAGVCSRHGCQRVHDTGVQYLCKRWLYKGDCASRVQSRVTRRPRMLRSPDF